MCFLQSDFSKDRDLLKTFNIFLAISYSIEAGKIDVISTTIES